MKKLFECKSYKQYKKVGCCDLGRGAGTLAHWDTVPARKTKQKARIVKQEYPPSDPLGGGGAGGGGGAAGGGGAPPPRVLHWGDSCLAVLVSLFGFPCWYSELVVR
jgi:hypothetical protein